MKKMLSCVLAGLLAAQGFGGSVFAGAAGQIKVGSAEVDPGASFELPVEITENPGITALSLELTYDASKLEFVGAADGKILGTSTFLGGKDLTLIPYTMNWDDLTDTDNTGTGNVAVLSFKAKEDASGSTEVKVAVNQKSTFNVDLDEVAFETASGTVTIKGETPAVVTTAPAATTAKPVVTTAKPVVTTAKPVVTTAKPVVTTAKPVVTTAKPVVTTAKPVVTTAKPVVTTAKPVVTTAKPVVTTAKPVVTTAKPVVTTAKPVVTTAKPVVTTAKPVATTAKPVATTAKVTTRIAATTAPVSTTGAAPVTTAPAETAVPIVTTVYMDNGMPKVEIVSPYIAPDSVEAHTGEKVKVPVRIQNNPGIAALSLNISYDNTKLKLLGAEDGKILGTSTFMAGNDLTLIPFTLNWDDLSTENNTGNGVVATLEFEVLAEGSSEVSVKVNQKSTFNIDLDEVGFGTGAGTVIATAPSKGMKGDVNLDGAVGIDDVQIALKAYTEGISGKGTGLKPEQEKNADVNENGSLSIDDVQFILIYYVNNSVAGKKTTWEELIPAQEPEEK